jgi:hypothetical protein
VSGSKEYILKEYKTARTIRGWAIQATKHELVVLGTGCCVEVEAGEWMVFEEGTPSVFSNSRLHKTFDLKEYTPKEDETKRDG